MALQKILSEMYRTAPDNESLPLYKELRTLLTCRFDQSGKG